MERSEPALVPEWLRCSGSFTGGGSSAHHSASSDAPSTLSVSNRAFRSINEKDSPRSSFLDRSSSSNSRHSSSSIGSTKHPYSSFTRSHREKSRDREKERSAIRDPWDHDISDPLASILSSRVGNTLRRSQSMVSRKPGEPSSRRASELRNSGSSGGSTVKVMQKASFEKAFPSLGTEEKQGVSDMGRVSSPGLSAAVQSLPVGNSGLIGGEGWTSALAEVPPIVGSNSIGTKSIQPNVSISGASSSIVGLNMAEALSQAPLRVHTTPQLPDKTQRLEELAIKQSRQLIPMTPSTPRPLVLNTSDKTKQQAKTTVRASDTIVAVKTAQQQPYSSQSATQSLRAGQVRPDTPKTSHSGKFLVLKPLRENVLSSATKDVSSTTNNTKDVPVAPSAPSAPLLSPNHLSALKSRSIVEKRVSLSQAKSRSDFFNLMRKKSSGKSSAIVQEDSSPAALSPTLKSDGAINEVVGDASPVSPLVTENGNKIDSNGDHRYDESNGFSNKLKKNLCLNGAVDPDEEEAAFLRSLGWEESAGEDEGLTEEEINAFYQEYMKLRPSLKVHPGAEQKISILSESCGSNSRKVCLN